MGGTTDFTYMPLQLTHLDFNLTTLSFWDYITRSSVTHLKARQLPLEVPDEHFEKLGAKLQKFVLLHSTLSETQLKRLLAIGSNIRSLDLVISDQNIGALCSALTRAGNTLRTLCIKAPHVLDVKIATNLRAAFEHHNCQLINLNVCFQTSWNLTKMILDLFNAKQQRDTLLGELGVVAPRLPFGVKRMIAFFAY